MRLPDNSIDIIINKKEETTKEMLKAKNNNIKELNNECKQEETQKLENDHSLDTR